MQQDIKGRFSPSWVVSERQTTPPTTLGHRSRNIPRRPVTHTRLQTTMPMRSLSLPTNAILDIILNSSSSSGNSVDSGFGSCSCNGLFCFHVDIFDDEMEWF